MNGPQRTPAAIKTLLLLAATLMLPGCAGNRAADQADLDPAPDARDRAGEVDSFSRRGLDLDARERELNSRLEELARREAALDERLRAIEDSPTTAPRADDFEDEELRPVDPAPRLVLVTLPAATGLEVEFLDLLSSETSLAGDPVRTRVARDVVQEGLVTIPAGSELLGAITEVVPQKRIGGQSRLAVEFEQLALPSGERLPLAAGVEFVGRRQKKKDATAIGGGAAAGAVLGRVLNDKDRDKGTLIGAVLGAAIGTAVASRNDGDPIWIEPGAVSEVTLDAPLQVAVLVEDDAVVTASNR